MWTLLKSIACWEKYQQDTARALGVVGMAIAWGNGPKEYPALVTTCPMSVRAGEPCRLLSAYVYMSDAAVLYSTAGMRTEAGTGEGQNKFNRWVSAYLLALIRELREIKAIKAQTFEQSLMESLQLVDEVATENRDNLAKLEKVQSDVLDRLMPPE